ncbi:MAG: type II secretion system GspH family protein [Armatimonadetes bacterium]|nr:type II secretion system GspH family protein [Armatimonadota bacterium]
MRPPLSHPTPSMKTRRGFTLVELLVVVAIVALLAALIFPLLFQGRRRARQAACQSNLQQLGRAFGLYVDDWDGVLPAPGGLYGERNYWDQGRFRGLDSYLRNRTGAGSVWACPELEEWNSQWEPRSYTMNTFLRDPPDVEPYTQAIRIREGLGLSGIPAPADTILLFEGTQNITENANTGRGYVYRDGDWTHARGYWRVPRAGYHRAHEAWHGSQNNYLFVDGHVKAMTPAPREPDRPKVGRNLWHVNK